MEKVRCNNTMAVYTEDELILIKEESEGGLSYYKGCSCCQTDKYLMDIGE